MVFRIEVHGLVHVPVSKRVTVTCIVQYQTVLSLIKAELKI